MISNKLLVELDLNLVQYPHYISVVHSWPFLCLPRGCAIFTLLSAPLYKLMR